MTTASTETVGSAPPAESPSVGEYLLAMSHEIRAPLNAVIGMSGLLLDGELTEKHRQYARSIHGAGESLAAILNDLIDLSRVGADRLPIEPIPFDLRSMVEETASVLSPRANERGLALRVDWRPELPRHVIGDPGRARQVLGNLVGHAVNGTSQGEVVIRVLPDGERNGVRLIRFVVEDTGIGIMPERLAQVFASYVPVDASPYRSFGVTGLGLRLSADLVRRMGGEIGAESEVGRGSRFWFTLPMASADPAAALELDRPKVGGRILIVESDPAAEKRYRAQVESSGWVASFIDDPGQLAATMRAALQTGEPFQACIISDYAVRPLHVDLATRLKADAGLAKVPLVMVTAVGSPGEGKKLWHAGYAAYLRKPVPNEEIRDALAALAQLDGEGRGPSLITRHSLAEVRNAQTFAPDGIDEMLASLKPAEDESPDEPAPESAPVAGEPAAVVHPPIFGALVWPPSCRLDGAAAAVLPADPMAIETAPAVVAPEAPSVDRSAPHSAAIEVPSGIPAESTGLVELAAGLVEPSAGLVEPTTGLIEPTTGLIEPTTGLVEPAAALAEATDAVVEAPAAIVDAPAAVVEMPAAVVETQAAVVETQAAVGDTTAAVVETPASVEMPEATEATAEIALEVAIDEIEADAMAEARADLDVSAPESADDSITPIDLAYPSAEPDLDSSPSVPEPAELAIEPTDHEAKTSEMTAEPIAPIELTLLIDEPPPAPQPPSPVQSTADIVADFTETTEPMVAPALKLLALIDAAPDSPDPVAPVDTVEHLLTDPEATAAEEIGLVVERDEEWAPPAAVIDAVDGLDVPGAVAPTTDDFAIDGIDDLLPPGAEIAEPEPVVREPRVELEAEPAPALSIPIMAPPPVSEARIDDVVAEIEPTAAPRSEIGELTVVVPPAQDAVEPPVAVAGSVEVIEEIPALDVVAPEFLDLVSRGSGFFVQHVIATCVRDVPVAIADLATACTRGDPAGIMAAGAAIQVAAGPVGAARLLDLVARMDQDVEADRFDSATGRVGAIEHAFLELRSTLDAAAPTGLPSEIPPVGTAFLDQLAPSREGPARALSIKLTDTFLTDGEARLAELRDAVAAGAADQVQRLAQTIKGMCGLISADTLGKLCALVEADARLKRVAQAARYLPYLDREFDRVRQAVLKARG